MSGLLNEGKSGYLPLKHLRLDPKNARIPERQRSSSTAELAELLVTGFEAYAVAQSIADNGYFGGEPMLVVPSETESGAWIVVEGNRRLAALLGLADASIRQEFSNHDAWADLASRRPVTLEDEVPVIMHKHRSDTFAEIARNHIVGKLDWRPYMQALFIADRVAEGLTIDEVAQMMGIKKSDAANRYRDQAVLLQAREYGLNTTQVEGAFSLLTVAMGSPKIRDHIGAPLGIRLEIGKPPIPATKLKELKETIQWLFGDEKNEPKITDGRQISGLGNVIANKNGLAALRSGKSLEEAKQIVEQFGLDPLESITKRLTAAKNSLISAASDIGEFVTVPEVMKIFEEIEENVLGMRTAINEIQDRNDR